MSGIECIGGIIYLKKFRIFHPVAQAAVEAPVGRPIRAIQIVDKLPTPIICKQENIKLSQKSENLVTIRQHSRYIRPRISAIVILTKKNVAKAAGQSRRQKSIGASSNSASMPRCRIFPA